jgi:hypothetical protein
MTTLPKMDHFLVSASDYPHSFTIRVELGMAEELSDINRRFDVAFRQQGQTVAGMSEALLEETAVGEPLARAARFRQLPPGSLCHPRLERSPRSFPRDPVHRALATP